MAESGPERTVGSVLQGRPARYAITAVILLVIGGLFVQRDLLGDESDSTVIQSQVVELGLLDDRSVKLNEPVPDFVLLNLDGDPVRLSDFRGKTVVLNFWASWCPPCRQEMPDLLEVYEERLPRDDFVVVAVDTLFEDSESAVVDFVEEFGLTFPVLFAPEEGLVRHFGVRGLPSTFFIDRDGVLRSVNLGPVFGDILSDGIALADAAGGDTGS